MKTILNRTDVKARGAWLASCQAGTVPKVHESTFCGTHLVSDGEPFGLCVSKIREMPNLTVLAYHTLPPPQIKEKTVFYIYYFLKNIGGSPYPLILYPQFQLSTDLGCVCVSP